MTWSEVELGILREHSQPEAAHSALTSAGFTRSLAAVRCKRYFLNRSGDVVMPLPTPLGTLPRFTARVAAALHMLAESNPTPETYDRRKAEILGEA